jgi:predicted GNAT family N-acyltransferase
MPELLSIELGDWSTLREEAAAIRFVVFVDEQKVPADLELDAWDAQCLHALARDPSGRAVATGRLLPDGHIGRMAVLRDARARGAGSLVLRTLMAAARERGYAETILSAQTHAIGFYAKHGYLAEGEVYDDCGIPHVDMRCRL